MRPEALRRLIQGYRLSQAISVSAALGVADLLADGPRDLPDLAAAAGVHAPSLHRLLRLLASEGIFTEAEPGRFALTPLGELLRSDVPGTQRNEAIFHGTELVWRPWGELLASVKTGEPAFDRVFATPIFPYLRAHPATAHVFNSVMVEETRLTVKAVIASYDFSGLRTIVDVGGGRGSLLAAILQAHPGARGVVFDQPTVVEEAAAFLTAAGVSDRCETVGGDFFQAVPEGGDAYLLKYILHDWDDERCVTLLRSCHRAMRDDARLLVLEMPLPAGNDPSYAKYIDVNMLVLTGGRERTEAEYETLLRAANLRLAAVLPTGTDFSVLEARKG